MTPRDLSVGYGVAAAFVTFALSAVVLARPDFLLPLLREDSLVESATAALFLVAAVLAILPGARRSPLRLFLPAAAALAVAEELGWGRRLLGLEAPTLHGTRFDGLHDLLWVGADLSRELYVASGLLVRSVLVSAVLIAAAACVRSAWLFARPVLRRLRGATPSARLFAGGCAWVLAALALDLVPVERVATAGGLLLFAEEVAELNAGLALLFAAASLRAEARIRRRRPVVVLDRPAERRSLPRTESARAVPRPATTPRRGRITPPPPSIGAAS